MGFKRKYLSADGLVEVVRDCLRQEKLEPVTGSEYSWQDCLMSGLALFAFKCPSLLQFEKMKASEPMIRRNLRTLYHVKKSPSDTCFRERLDQLSHRKMRAPFKKIFSHLQRGKALESFRYLEGHYIVSIDGTGQYSSKKVRCDNCCERKHRNGTVSYYHHMLGACIVHPDKKSVIPLAPEPITKEDGRNKNDCERNASKRLLQDLRREHPHLKMLIVEDGLASNYPHLSLIDSLNMDYIVGAKPGDHSYLFDWIKDMPPQTLIKTDEKGSRHELKYYTNVPLNDAHHDYRVNVIDHTEIQASGKQQHFSWVTNLSINDDNVYRLMRAARSRWRIENETFNTLKNQGYHFEHNFGHGKKNLCSVMTMLMLLAFLIDQVQALCCKHYVKAQKHVGAFKLLFQTLCSLIRFAVWEGFEQLLVFVGNPNERSPPDGCHWMTS